jgi:hypothetical protein
MIKLRFHKNLNSKQNAGEKADSTADLARDLGFSGSQAP